MGEFLRLNRELHKRVKECIRKRCANCDDIYCLLLDDGDPCVCPQRLTRSLLCRYFIEAVLPDDQELYEAITSGDERKRCKRCCMPFTPRGNHALYCDRCRPIINRRKARERARRYRANA